jgi:UDP-glucose 4-epimerase
MALAVPLLDTSRAREVLGGEPRRGAGEAFLELFDGLRDGAWLDTPPLARRSGGPLRVRELLTAVGGRSR